MVFLGKGTFRNCTAYLKISIKNCIKEQLRNLKFENLSLYLLTRIQRIRYTYQSVRVSLNHSFTSLAAAALYINVSTN